jgi:hypothetical protein
VNLKEQMLLMQSFNDKSNKAIATLYANATRDFGRFEESIGEGLKVVNETDRFLKSLKLELKRELNEYAVKDVSAIEPVPNLFLCRLPVCCSKIHSELMSVIKIPT